MKKEAETTTQILTVHTLKEIAIMYGVSDRTLKKWLLPFEEKIGKKVGWYYSVNQVKVIFQSLGLPNRTIENKSVNVD
ncbi:MAG: hypothetical protein JNM95_12235 [Chitinophagaceae bacterium]|nr:hypothetical protein [Chitinophagaceae bacterium]